MRLRLTISCTGLGLILLASGCGGGGDSTSSAPALKTSSLDRAAYTKKVESICKSWKHEVLEAMREVGVEPKPGTTPTEAIQEVWPGALREEAQRVRAVGAPTGDQEKVQAYITAIEATAEKVEAEKPNEIFALQKLLEGVNRSAGAYGLEECEF